MIPSYLSPDQLHERMIGRPAQPFFVRAGHYSVIDGDTLRIHAPSSPGEPRLEAFRIRLADIDTPELRKASLFDEVLRHGGFDPTRDGPGEMARAALRSLCQKRALLVDPVILEGAPANDVYGRLLARVCVSGQPGKDFDLTGAQSVEHHLFRQGLARVLPDHDLPAVTPALLGRIRETLDHRAREKHFDETPQP